MRITNGTLFFDGANTVSSDATVQAEAIILGDGVASDNDAKIVVLPGANIELLSGYLVNENVGA